MLKGYKRTFHRVRSRERSPLSRVPTRQPDYYANEDDYKKMMSDLGEQLAHRQEILYAHGRHALVVIFQGMDASGKDGAIKHVISSLNPQGVSVATFRAPTEDDIRHDFLWRAQAKLPIRGTVGIFNRSYYEELTTVRVNPEFLTKQRLPESLQGKSIFRERQKDIVNYESYLSRQGYRVIKFYLHLSRKEQKERLLDRIAEPDKNWKFDPSDMRDRANWTAYMRAYNETLSSTSHTQGPWYVIPADDKKNARLVISQILVDELNELPLRWPQVTADQKRELQKIRRQLETE